jgi:hypothetical protein
LSQIALLNIVDEADVHIKVNHGSLKGMLTVSREATFCAHTILEDSPEVVVVKDALQDPR